MAFYGNDVGIIPLTDAAGITKPFKAGSHYGVDIGWSSIANKPNCDVLAWQEGKVVGKGYYSDTGYWVALEHRYNNGKKRWTCYIHLKQQASVNVGDKVAFGGKIGIRGTSGHSSGVHLHLYLTKEIPISLVFSYSALKANSVDPVPYLYYSKQFNTLYISPNSWKKPLPDPIPEVVDPVERDTAKNQLICHEADLRVRKEPSLKGDKLGYLQKDKYYNFYESKEADGYTWYRIAEGQWIAKIESVDILPKVEIVNPVPRDENKDQLTCSISNLRVRTAPSLKGEVLGFLKQDSYYDYFEELDADGYKWLRIAEKQWVAKVDEVTLLPAIKYYIVEKGDTLQSIALKCGLSLDELLNLNQLIQEGDKLRIR